jgi:hypothetical protein
MNQLFMRNCSSLNSLIVSLVATGLAGFHFCGRLAGGQLIPPPFFRSYKIEQNNYQPFKSNNKLNQFTTCFSFGLHNWEQAKSPESIYPISGIRT